MISQEVIQKLALQHQTREFPNIVREYFQHLFLSELYKLPRSEQLLFKGGTALRIVYGSPRFSEDLDFSLFRVLPHEQKKFVENLFGTVLAAIERVGIKVEIGGKSDRTSGGYFGEARFQLYDYQLLTVTINVSSRNGRDVKGEVETIANDFIPTYNLLHLPKDELVYEKIFLALPERKKERDFYDLYFMLRRDMLSPEQKRKLAGVANDIIQWAIEKDFRRELGVFLPLGQQQIITDFRRALSDELRRQIAGN